jgi:hypothetical protein
VGVCAFAGGAGESDGAGVGEGGALESVCKLICRFTLAPKIPHSGGLQSVSRFKVPQNGGFWGRIGDGTIKSWGILILKVSS